MDEPTLIKRAKKLAKKYGFKIVSYHGGFTAQESENDRNKINKRILWYTENSIDGTARLYLNFGVWATEEILTFYRELIPSVSWKMNRIRILWKVKGMRGWESCLYIDIHDPEFIWKSNALKGSTP